MQRKITAFFCFFLSFAAIFVNAQEGTILREVYLNEVYFDFASYLIKDEMKPILNKVAEESESIDNFFIEITAHTDSIGSVENNQALSQKRADAVKAYFVKMGIPGESISAQIYGETDPVADNTTEEGRKLNRRSSIILYEVLPKDPELDPEMLKDKEEEMVEEVTEPEPKEVVEEAPAPPPPPPPPPPVEEEKEPEVIYESEEGQDTIKAGETFEIKDLFFEEGSSSMKNSSTKPLQNIIAFMKANPLVKIEIGGHINLPLDVPLTEEDHNLSENRAKTVYQFLLISGISEDRMEYRGYGNTQMKYPFAKTVEEEDQNMRVEIKVLEIGR